MSQLDPAPKTHHTGNQSSTLIVIPARDEASTIGEVITALIASGWSHIFVIDDHSTDNTGTIARCAGAIVARPVLPLGAWGGMQLGIRHAVAQGFQSVITMDADGQHEVAEIPRLLVGAVNADVVIGAHPERASRLRQIAWHWFRAIAGFELRDLTSGFRCYNRAAMELLATDEATLLDYQDVGVLLLVRKAGLRLLEVPVSMATRQVGKSRIFYSWFSVLRYMITTTLLCLARWGTPTRDAPVNK
jgi:glycosyltransferase involved in cell wall biosynthesis